MRGTETHNPPAQGTGTEAERLSSAVQERALPEPAAEGMLKKVWKLLKYDNYIMSSSEDKKLHP